MTTTLIFVTVNDASPAIHLDATRDELLQYLAGLPSMSPRAAAVRFLRDLPADRFDSWAPALESAPVQNLDDLADDDLVAFDRELDIAWEPEFRLDVTHGG